MDLAKACAGLLHARQSSRTYHDGAPIEASRTPFVAVPATAGTGSEATAVCVLTNQATGVKKSFRHPSFLARVAILDPELLASCPPEVTAASGMDAFAQAFESFVSRGASRFTDGICIEAMSLIGNSLESMFLGYTEDKARDLLQGSFLAGLALSNARLGLVHGLAHPLGARYHAPHGLVCAVCLPSVIEFNRPVCADAYARIREALGRDPRDLSLHYLHALGIRSPFVGQPVTDEKAIIRETLQSGSTAANPRPVAAADVEALLEELFR